MYLVVVVLLIVVVGFLLLRTGDREEKLRKRLRQRPDELKPVAEQLKLELIELQDDERETAIDTLLAGTCLHQRARDSVASAGHVVCGGLEGHQVTMFDHHEDDGVFTVLVVRAREGEALPRFCLRPRDVNVEVAAGHGSLVPPDHVLFNESFRLDVLDEDRDRLASRLLNGPAMDMIEKRVDQRLWIEGLGDRLLVYVVGRIVPASRVEGFLRDGVRLAASLAG
jgi:hypothetical protein